MKDIMKEVDGKVKFSMADSTMMLLVQQAMDKAHEKIKTKHGLLLRLNAISLFYELAVLQLESCLNFVQQETDNLESNHEEVVHDLRKIKDRLHHRLLETELAILEKDRELLERSENEASLRNVLESKETELVHLQDLERNRSSCNNNNNNKITGDEFSELKSSVDHQVMNLRQKIETDYDHQLGEDDPSGVDIDVLKGTMDLAFNKMHHAIFLSELGPIEQSWRWSIERETMGLLIKGFMNGLEDERKKVLKVVRDYELGFKDRVCLIRREVECLEESQIIILRSSSSSPRATTSIDCEVVHDDKEEEEEGEEDSSNYPVSKLIKSHESIIRRKSEELVPPKIESVKRQRSYNGSSLKRAVDVIVAGLDSLLCLNTKLLEHFCFNDDDDNANDHHEVVMEDGLDDVWKKMQKHNRLVLSENEVEEKEDVEMELMILGDTYLTLLRGLLTDNIKKTEKEDTDESQKKDLEILREDEEFRQELDWIIVRELVREVSETVENQKRIEAENKRLLEEQGKRATSLVFDDFEILCEDKEFRQEMDWSIVRELLREVSEDYERVEADNKRLLEVEVKRACFDISLVFDDFDFKIQEKLEKGTIGLRNLEKNIDSMMGFIVELRRKEAVYRTAFVLRSENLIKAETEVDLLGDQVDSLVKLLQKTLWTFHQHPLLLCNHSDISEMCKMIKEVLYEAN